MPTHKYLGPLAEKLLHLLSIIPEVILHVLGRCLVVRARERIAYIDRTLLCSGREIRLVKRVRLRMAAADEEERGSQFAACVEEARAFFDETAERRDAGTGGGLDQWSAIHFAGEVEGWMRGFDVKTDGVAWLKVGEEVGADADKAFAGALESFLV